MNYLSRSYYYQEITTDLLPSYIMQILQSSIKGDTAREILLSPIKRDLILYTGKFKRHYQNFLNYATRFRKLVSFWLHGAVLRWPNLSPITQTSSTRIYTGQH